MTCICGNELPPTWLAIHQRGCGPFLRAAREEVSTMPGGSDASFEKAKSDYTNFTAAQIAARKEQRDQK